MGTTDRSFSGRPYIYLPIKQTILIYSNYIKYRFDVYVILCMRVSPVGGNIADLRGRFESQVFTELPFCEIVLPIKVCRIIILSQQDTGNPALNRND